jgi:hypothetical protein
MYKSLYEELSIISELKTTKEKIEAILMHRRRDAFKALFGLAYDQNIKWLLPEGEPPFKPTEAVDVEGRLLNEIRRMYLFVEGGNANLTKSRREFLFIQLLESIHPLDAKLIISIKDRKLPFKGLTKKIAQQAFPDLNIEAIKEEA